MIRVFTALPLPEEVKAELSDVSAALGRGISARWVRPEGMHLTMKFLGDVDEKNIRGIGERLDELSLRYSPFDMRLNGLGAFPSPRRARVIWAGVETDVQTMKELAASVDMIASGYGVPKEERSFAAHITLARLRAPSMVNLDARVRGITFISDRVNLYKSDLTPQGAKYTLLHSSPFAGKTGG